MFITMIGMTEDGEPIDKPFIPKSGFDMMFMMGMPKSSDMLVDRNMNSFNIVHAYAPEVLARFNNRIQKLSERTRLGIPVTIGTDPRHGTENNPGAAIFTSGFSQWPSSLGLAATREHLIGQRIRQYRSPGVPRYRDSSGPASHGRSCYRTQVGQNQWDLWRRRHAVCHDDKGLCTRFPGRYFVNRKCGLHDQAFFRRGPQENGEDAHFAYGKNQVYPGSNFDYHLIPFEEGAFPANTAQIMPYYGIPIDQTEENVAFAFNKRIITTMLRDKYGFDGVICTDWNIINDSKAGEARAWGVENLSPLERTQKVLEAGCDQFGGEASPEHIVKLVQSGTIQESRIDESVKRIMRDKFTLGLFDDPYVTEEEAGEVAGADKFRELGKIAQARSAVLLKNEQLLPLKKGTKVYLEGVNDPKVFSSYGEVVDKAEDAEVIIKRIQTPFDPRSDYFLEQFFHQGRLFYTEEEKQEILKVIGDKPSVVIANLERPAILTEINGACSSLMAEFGVSDEVLAKLIFGAERPEGKLPFELPSSWEAVENQKEDLPYDSRDPLYPFGHGLSYEASELSMNR